ncbi:MAG: cysteine synthase family protein [Treponema sp.]|jgi:cysteine synthase B|nr:cysteine synthase family protein [Treponema sp.]
MKLIDMVGNTPLIELGKISPKRGPSIQAKAEFHNPSGSVKDRAARAMLLDGIEKGLLRPGKTIIDASSGNTGIAYAMFGAFLGYPVTIYLPANANNERKNLIRRYGALIVETDPLESSDGAFLAAQKEAAAQSEKYFYPNQYNNDVNWKAHYNGTAPEIWEQTGGRVTHFIAGMGTSGTLMGTGRRLKELNPAIRVVAIQPDSPFHGIEGTKHMASTIKPGFYDESLADSVIEVNTEEAYETARQLVRKEGIFAGISSGANVLGALKLAASVPEDSLIVTILGDSGTRYLQDRFWEGGNA